MHSAGRKHSQVCWHPSPTVLTDSQFGSVTIVGGAIAGSGACAHAININSNAIVHLMILIFTSWFIYFWHSFLKGLCINQHMKKRLLGWILLLIGLTPFLTFLLFGRPQYIVWFSNHTFIILGLAVLFNSRFWVFAELCLGAIPELVWSFDFLWQFFTGVSPLGITTYMFKNGNFDWLHLYSLQHILFVPVALYALYLLGGPVRQAWLGSLAQGIVMFGLSLPFGSDFNINCVFYKCTWDLPFYEFTWPIFMIAHIFIVYFVLMSFKKKKK